MPRAARDRIKFPRGFFVKLSIDDEIRARSHVNNILHILGDIVDAVEAAGPGDFSCIEWTSIQGLGSAKYQAANPAAISAFIIRKANAVSTAYSEAIRRRKQLAPQKRSDLVASK